MIKKRKKTKCMRNIHPVRTKRRFNIYTTSMMLKRRRMNVVCRVGKNRSTFCYVFKDVL